MNETKTLEGLHEATVDSVAKSRAQKLTAYAANFGSGIKMVIFDIIDRLILRFGSVKG